MSKLANIFEKGSQVHVGSVVVYGNTSDSKLYDNLGDDKVQVKQAVVEQAFLAGKLLVAVPGAESTDPTAYYRPVAVIGTAVLTGFSDATSVSGKTVMGVVSWAAAANS